MTILDTEKTQKINLVVELGPMTMLMLIQLLLVTLKLIDAIVWNWVSVFSPTIGIVLFITAGFLVGIFTWATSNFILWHKRRK